MIVLLPINTFLPKYTWEWIFTFSPITTFSSAIENLSKNKLFPYLTELCNEDFLSIPTLLLLELLKWLRSFEKAELGSLTLINVGFIFSFRTKSCLTITIAALEEYIYSVYFGFPKKVNDSLSPLSILESLVILDSPSPSTTPPTKSAISWAFKIIRAKV